MAIMENKVKYWIELSEYDFDTAKAMLRSKRYLYVGFMAHQSIEKLLKAFYVQTKQETAPFSHSLSYLAKESGIYNSFSEEQKDFIDKLEPLNIEARYPTHKDQLLKSLTEEHCSDILKNVQEIREWISQKL